MKHNNIITYSQENSKQSPVPMPYWTYPEQVYNELKLMYPTSFDKKNRTWLLETIIIDRFIIGRLEVPLAHHFVMGICGRGKRYSGDLIEAAQLNLNGLFELYNYSDALEEELLLMYSKKQLGEEGWVNKGYTYRNTNGQHDIDGCRVAIYSDVPKFENIKELYINTRYTTNERVYVLTGSLVSKQSIKTIRRYIEEYGANLSKYYKKKGTLPGMIEYLELVNKLVNNKSRTKLIKENAPLVLDWLIECRDNNTGVCEDLNENTEKINMLYNHHKNTVEKLLDMPVNLYRLPRPSSPRVFDGTDQCLAREVRGRIFPTEANCVDLDLARSQLVIIASLSGNKELAKWATKNDIWEDIWLHTGIAKHIAKPCLYTYCFGGNANTWYNEGYIEKEYAEELKVHPLYVALAKAGRDMRAKATELGYVQIGSHKLELNKDIDARSAVAQQVQYIESMIISSVVEYIADNEDKINLMGVFHDGVLVKFKNRYKPINYVKEMNEIVDTTAQEYGVSNVKLDIKM